jgi:uncharacterized protein DUF3631
MRPGLPMVRMVGAVTVTRPAPGTMAAEAEAGCFLLDQVAAELARYVAFPSPEARDAVALWAAHAHAATAFESTPRLALLSPEKGSGKTRTLEVLDLLVPEPMHAVNATAAAIFRAVEAHQPTLLFDEADTVFGPLARGEHEELRGLVNAGHRKGAVAYRCVGDPANMEVKAFPAFCAVAIAGIGDLPDTILDRAVLVRMRRRGPGEQVEPFRRRKAAPRLRELHEALAAWTWTHHDQLAQAEPEMPPGLVDRPADVWEALLAIADLAGGDWPTRARKAAVKLNKERGEADPSLGVALLRDVRAVWDGREGMPTEELLRRLAALEESPWGDLRGKPLDARGLARRLRPFDVRPTNVRVGEEVRKGYLRADLHDAWTRYLPHPEARATAATALQPQASGPPAVAGSHAAGSATRHGSATQSGSLTSSVAPVAHVAPSGDERNGALLDLDHLDHDQDGDPGRWTR